MSNERSAVPDAQGACATPDEPTFPARLRSNAAFLRDCHKDLGEAEAGVIIRNLRAAADRIEELERELALFAPMNGDRTDTSLENWFPLSAEELARTKRAHANALGTAAELERKLAQSDVLYAQVLLGQRQLHRELTNARQALRLAKEEIEFDAAYSVVSGTGERRVVSQALDAINAALASSQGTPQDGAEAK